MNYVDAWRKFTDSEQFKSASEPLSLGPTHSSKAKIYLQNRLISAFEAGWNAASNATSAVASTSTSEGGK